MKIYSFKKNTQEGFYSVQAANSDDALVKCLAETQWPIHQILYLGSEKFRFYWTKNGSCSASPFRYTETQGRGVENVKNTREAPPPDRDKEWEG